MGFWDKVKETGKKTAEGISRGIKTVAVENKKSNESFQIKRKILLNLSIDELKNLAYLVGLKDLEYETYFEEGSLSPKKRKIKLNKFDYVDKIAKKPYSELNLKLKHLHKSVLADEMEREISFIEKRYDEEKEIIKKGISQEENEKRKDVLLLTLFKTIVDEILAINPERYKNEREYQIGLKEALKVAVRKEFQRSKTAVEMGFPTKTGRRIDIMIQIDNYRIGVETKYDLTSSGSFQRAIGQIHEYAGFLDALILVQYKSLEDEVGLRNLKELTKKIDIPLEIIANGVKI